MASVSMLLDWTPSPNTIFKYVLQQQLMTVELSSNNGDTTELGQQRHLGCQNKFYWMGYISGQKKILVTIPHTKWKSSLKTLYAMLCYIQARWYASQTRNCYV